jgi:Flp pilus assembly protein TadG
VAVAGLLLAAGLIVLVGFGIDVAHAFIVRRDLTGIADQAALVGSQQLDIQAWREGTLALDPQAAIEAADTELASTPGVTGTASADTGAVTVQASESFSTLVLRLVGIPTMTVAVGVTATPEQP